MTDICLLTADVSGFGKTHKVQMSVRVFVHRDLTQQSSIGEAEHC